MNVDNLGAGHLLHDGAPFCRTALPPFKGRTSQKAGLSLYPQPAADHASNERSRSAFGKPGDLTGKPALSHSGIITNDILDLSAIPADTYVVNAVAKDGRRFSPEAYPPQPAMVVPFAP